MVEATPEPPVPLVNLKELVLRGAAVSLKSDLLATLAGRSTYSSLWLTSLCLPMHPQVTEEASNQLAAALKLGAMPGLEKLVLTCCPLRSGEDPETHRAPL